MTQGKEKHKQNFKERGITLIALVITIIVLLILAGVALSALTGDSGILNNAESARDKTNLANAKEQVALAAQGALTKGHAQGSGTITKENLESELDNIVGTGKYELSGEESPWTVKVGKYETLVYATGKIEQNENSGGTGDGRDTTTLPSRTGTTPWLPAGFSQVIGTTLDTGLTIANTSNGTPGTQNYVWIEIPTTEQVITLSDGTTKTIHLAGAKNDSEILEILEVYAGKGTTTNYRNSSYKDQWHDSEGNTIATDENKEDTAGCGMTYYEYQTAYSKMLKSIQRYGGFWLAQYEAGIEFEKDGEASTHRTDQSPRITNPVSANYAKDKYPYNNVYCSEAQKIANADSTSSYTSSLPFGIQWDLVCKFLEVKTNLEYADIASYSKWGNYADVGWTSSTSSKYSDDYGKSFTTGSKEKSSEEEYLLTTGAIESTTEGGDASPMNIYDFAGNVYEWTLEHTAKTYAPCAAGGGTYYNNGGRIYPAAHRILGDTAYGWRDTGFRSTLY